MEVKRFQSHMSKTLPVPQHSHLEGDKELQLSCAEIAMRKLSSKRDLLIYKEIIDLPISLRPPPF